jgi:hypothetical protein
MDNSEADARCLNELPTICHMGAFRGRSLCNCTWMSARESLSWYTPAVLMRQGYWTFSKEDVAKMC